ncbi:leucine rich repeat [Seminavis robusta]|uniref:Leucine rich repeat n=1 Tax=Seminavis robusta TaxID=568900 RepID=A0A9N8EJD4_9STRA|nr:leucine rich repeat [Seminavis robusta]|eukprot:Sro1273_g258360.1 leucine rich repeat (163) ;mRNA; r:29786-30354
MSALSNLYLESSQLSGQLPSEIGNLQLMTHLSLFGANSLAGTLPTEIGTCTSLNVLTISYTSLRGSIPTEISRLSTTLSDLDLSYNNLQLLPSELGLLTGLGSLYLQVNPELAGTLPTELGRLTALQFFDISGCALYGSLPSEFCALVPQLTLFEHDLGACP